MAQKQLHKKPLGLQITVARKRAKNKSKKRDKLLATQNEYAPKYKRCCCCSINFLAAGKQQTHCKKCISVVDQIAATKKRLAVEKKLDQQLLREYKGQ
ncbi:MAG: hypothetical protein E4G74_02130 [Erysipelotrichales bacterium]|nr:MAG: hypothetical protein E4G74_02130 [Erysipelotrichales bacterium]